MHLLSIEDVQIDCAGRGRGGGGGGWRCETHQDGALVPEKALATLSGTSLVGACMDCILKVV